MGFESEGGRAEPSWAKRKQRRKVAKTLRNMRNNLIAAAARSVLLMLLRFSHHAARRKKLNLTFEL